MGGNAPVRIKPALLSHQTECGSDAREAVKALIVANTFLETDLEKLRAAASPGYARGKLPPRNSGSFSRIQIY